MLFRKFTGFKMKVNEKNMNKFDKLFLNRTINIIEYTYILWIFHKNQYYKLSFIQ